MAQFVKTIQNFSFQNNLWQSGAKIVVGVSGGADSACLLDVLATLKDKYNFQLHIAHVNYNLRGKDSDRDELFVRKLGEKYGIEVSVLKPNKAEYKGNLENYLRNLRYNFFEKLRVEFGYDLIAIAHSSDDQAETVLMRILRGAGLNGLSAMKPKTNFLIRPLLGTSRIEIIAYLKEKKLKYRIDKSNSDTNFLRSRVRHKLIPYLEKGFNGGIKNTLGGWALTVADDYEYISKQAERFPLAVCTNKSIKFEAKNFLKQHLALQRQILRRAISCLKSNLKDIESSHIEEILKIIKSDKGKNQKASFKGLNISKKSDTIEIFC